VEGIGGADAVAQFNAFLLGLLLFGWALGIPERLTAKWRS
jgi:hypothetical protein